MDKIIKVFVDDPAALDEYEVTVLEAYDSFVLAQSTSRTFKEIAGEFPIEDITGHYKITIDGREIDTSRPRINEEGATVSHPAYRGQKALSSGKHHYLVQFIGPVKSKWLSALKRKGAQPREPFQNYSYVVRSDEKTLALLTKLPYVRWVGHLSHHDRLRIVDSAQQLPRTHVFTDVYIVQFFDPKDLKAGVSKVKKCGAKIISQDAKSAQLTIQIEGSGKKANAILDAVSAVHGVRSIRCKIIKRTSNDVAAGIINARQVYAPKNNLTGRGEIVAVCDTGLDSGDINDIHPDFRGRVIGIESYPIAPSYDTWVTNPGADDGGSDVDTGHGTHVAGSVLGSGSESAQPHIDSKTIKGLAPEAKLFFQAVEQKIDWINPDDEKNFGRYMLAGLPDDVTGMFNSAYKKGARIHSNSWGGGDPGAYDSTCLQLDDFVWKHKDFCVLVAVGNDGTDKDGNGRVNLLSVTSPATAKNCISVGASESLREEFNTATYGNWWPRDYPVPPLFFDRMATEPEQVSAFSSRGPTTDGRIKPDVVAPGTFILSTRSTKIASNNRGWGSYPPSGKYFFMGGTSMATPITSGAVALIRQFLRDWIEMPNPSAALLKAALITSAVRLPNPTAQHPLMDNDQGYGLINVDGIVATPSGVEVYFVDEPTGLATGESADWEITVASSEIPFRVTLAYTDYPGEFLVNNLNLVVVSPEGEIVVGNGSSGQNLQTDTQNNSEVVQVEYPSEGVWTVRIIGSNVPHGPQDYALCLRGNIEMK